MKQVAIDRTDPLRTAHPLMFTCSMARNYWPMSIRYLLDQL